MNPQEAWINPADAKERSIKQGDKIRVKNAFGEIEILAKVTPRVVPGTVCISQGAWPVSYTHLDVYKRQGQLMAQ